MLTSLYYYGYYKPYIYSTESSPRNKKIGKSSDNENLGRFRGIETKDYTRSGSESSSYFLNYSDKKEVKSVISGISDNINGIKDTVRYMQNVKRGRNARYDGGKSAYGDGLEDFSSDFNSLEKFVEGKNISTDIKSFGGKVKEIVENNEELLKEFGVKSDGEKLEFDRDVYDSLSLEEYKEKSSRLNSAFSEIYGDAVDVLSKPMAQHLSFRDLNCYYNYSYSTKSKEPLGFIDTGLVVDIIL